MEGQMTRMIRLLPALVLAGATWACSPASQPAPPEEEAVVAPENVQEVVTGLEREWVAAILAKDPAPVQRLLADDFLGMTDNVRYSKSDAIEDVTTGTHKVLTLSDIEVRVFGDTAIASMEQTEESTHGTEDFSGQRLFTDVWVKRDGQWRAVASIGSRIR
jgi:ketosteroid isomerase-like protein